MRKFQRNLGQWLGIGLVGLCLLFGGATSANPTPGEDFVRKYKWMFDDEVYEMSYSIPWKVYNFYESKPRVYENYAVYAYEHADYTFLNDFAQALKQKASEEGLSDWQTIRFIVSFVQHLTYVRETGEYPKFPVETLADRGGDCEDTSILLAALLDRLGYDIMLVNPPGHMAIALACRNCEGTSFAKGERRYFYIETTSTGFEVGELPKEYIGNKVNLFPLKASEQELWVLNAKPNQAPDRSTVYYVQEEGGQGVRHAGPQRVITTTTTRTITINGRTYTKTTVSHRLE